jgi:hypothetical protein
MIVTEPATAGSQAPDLVIVADRIAFAISGAAHPCPFGMTCASLGV